MSHNKATIMFATSNTAKVARVPNGVRHIDLLLPKHKKPTAIEKAFAFEPKPLSSNISSYAIGSSLPNELIYHQQDLGLFQGIQEAWKNHWNLRTRPEDWWFPVAMRIAKAIDEAAQIEGRRNGRDTPVRDLFVSHEGKKMITVDVDVYQIEQVQPDHFFDSMAEQIGSRIKIPEFARVMQNDFSSSLSTHQVASQINLMASMQQFFEYEMGLCGCGIKGLEMLGEQEDWDKLVAKLRQVRAMLKSLSSSLCLWDDWWDHVEMVYKNLSKTFAMTSNEEHMVVARDKLDGFWADVLIEGKGWKYYGPSGMNKKEADEYNGWIIKFLTGRDSIFKEDMGDKETLKEFSGINSVPMKVTYKYLEPPKSEEVKLLAGIMGFQVHKDTFNQVPSVEPNHMWAIVKENSMPSSFADVYDDEVAWPM